MVLSEKRMPIFFRCVINFKETSLLILLNQLIFARVQSTNNVQCSTTGNKLNEILEMLSTKQMSHWKNEMSCSIKVTWFNWTTYEIIMTIYRCCRWQENIFIETDRVNIVPGTRSYGPKGSNIVRNSMKSTKICRMIGTKKNKTIWNTMSFTEKCLYMYKVLAKVTQTHTKTH